MLLMRTYPLMPKVDGNSHEKSFHRTGILLSGHDMPERKSRGTEVKTNSNIQASRLGTRRASVKAKKMQERR